MKLFTGQERDVEPPTLINKGCPECSSTHLAAIEKAKTRGVKIFQQFFVDDVTRDCMELTGQNQEFEGGQEAWVGVTCLSCGWAWLAGNWASMLETAPNKEKQKKKPNTPPDVGESEINFAKSQKKKTVKPETPKPNVRPTPEPVIEDEEDDLFSKI